MYLYFLNIPQFPNRSQNIAKMESMTVKELPPPVIPSAEFLRCCHITANFVTAASQNGVCMTQQMCHTMIPLGKLFDKRLK
jgi:hypothetical protein